MFLEGKGLHKGYETPWNREAKKCQKQIKRKSRVELIFCVISINKRDLIFNNEKKRY